jgi:Bacterial transcriptional activator domain
LLLGSGSFGKHSVRGEDGVARGSKLWIVERSDAEAIYEQGPEAVVAVLVRMDEQIARLDQRVVEHDERVERLSAEGFRALADDELARARRALHEALSLWRGPALAEFAFETVAASRPGRRPELPLLGQIGRIPPLATGPPPTLGTPSWVSPPPGSWPTARGSARTGSTRPPRAEGPRRRPAHRRRRRVEGAIGGLGGLITQARPPVAVARRCRRASRGCEP